jgi:hypothetical protein
MNLMTINEAKMTPTMPSTYSIVARHFGITARTGMKKKAAPVIWRNRRY